MKYQLGKTILNSVLITLLLLFLTNLLQPLKAATWSEREVAESLEGQLTEALSHSGWAMASTVGASLLDNSKAHLETSGANNDPDAVLNIFKAGLALPESEKNLHLMAIFTLILLLSGASLFMRQQCQKMQLLKDE
ncbi:hypothetical protein [Motilimonas sp. E26]|uniref:hypothetical protein n=1 Tax=Motilimonas TaxID=1914248 RepID=UPI001E5ECE49|nr:hypothetical protein [Motilimonas sp. E26]MCE0558428.1 hypothetical protein [Motilimonas sp. E26]